MVSAGRPEPLVTATDAPDPREEAAISDGLGRFNEEQTQAPGFYESHGYRVLGNSDCLPAGTSRIFMTKRLA